MTPPFFSLLPYASTVLAHYGPRAHLMFAAYVEGKGREGQGAYLGTIFVCVWLRVLGREGRRAPSHVPLVFDACREEERVQK